MDLDVNMRTGSCPYAVQFYGALFREVGSNCFYDCHCILYYVLFYLSSRAVVNNKFFLLCAICCHCARQSRTVWHSSVKTLDFMTSPLRVSQNCPWVAADSLLCANVSSTKLEVYNILHCRMTNYELLRWLLETPSRDYCHLTNYELLRWLLETPSSDYCRLTNYELLRWLVETPSRDFAHYPVVVGQTTILNVIARVSCL